MSKLRTNEIESLSGTATDFPNSLSIAGTPAGTAATQDVQRFPYVVGSVAELASLPAGLRVEGQVIELSETLKAGDFKWIEGDFSSEVSSDPRQGIYVPAVGVNPSLGCWVRQYKLGTVEVEWWGTDHLAFQDALDIGGEIGINGIIDIGANTVSMKKRETVLVGRAGLDGSTVRMAGGSFSVGLYNETQNSSVEGITFRNSEVTGDTFSVADTSGNIAVGPFYYHINRCKIVGGGKSVNIDSAIWVEFSSTLISNQNVGSYSVYAENTIGTMQGLYFDRCYINGVSFIGGARKFYGVSFTQTIIENGFGNQVLEVDNVGAFGFTDSYLESFDDATKCLRIGPLVAGGAVTNSKFHQPTAASDCIFCDGRAITFSGNFMDPRPDTGFNAIELGPNSKYCVIEANADQLTDEGIGASSPTIVCEDNGEFNKVYGYTTKTQWINASSLNDSFGLALTQRGTGYDAVFLPAGADNFGNYLVELPNDIPLNGGQATVEIVYQLVGTIGDIELYWELRPSNDFASGTVATFSDVVSNVSAALYRDSRSVGIAATSGHNIMRVRVGRVGTSAADTHTGDVILLGLKLNFSRTIGY